MDTTALVPVTDGAVPVRVVRASDDAAGPALVIMPSAFGITDDLVGQMRELAAHAALVAAPDVFWRSGPTAALPYGDFPAVMARLNALDRAKAASDFAAVIAWARSQPGCDGRVVGLGICFGGPFCFMAAARGELQGVVTWHGSRLENYVHDAAAMRCPMSLQIGEKDRVLAPDSIAKVRAAFAGRADVEIAVHPGADHGFSHPSAPTWDPVAAAAGMRAVERILAEASPASDG